MVSDFTSLSGPSPATAQCLRGVGRACCLLRWWVSQVPEAVMGPDIRVYITTLQPGDSSISSTCRVNIRPSLSGIRTTGTRVSLSIVQSGLAVYFYSFGCFLLFSRLIHPLWENFCSDLDHRGPRL